MRPRALHSPFLAYQVPLLVLSLLDLLSQRTHLVSVSSNRLSCQNGRCGSLPHEVGALKPQLQRFAALGRRLRLSEKLSAARGGAVPHRALCNEQGSRESADRCVSVLPLVEADGLCAHNLRFLVPPTSCGQAHLARCNILLPSQDLSFWKVRDNRGPRLLDSSFASLGLRQMAWERRLVSRLYN